MINEEHQPPHGVISAEDAAAPEEFMVGRLSHSTVVTPGDDGSSTDEDASGGSHEARHHDVADIEHDPPVAELEQPNTL